MDRPDTSFDTLQRLSDEQLSRRNLIKRAGMLGLSTISVSALLAACGSDDDDEPEDEADPTSPPAAETETGDADPTATSEPDAEETEASDSDPTAAEQEDESTAEPDQSSGEPRQGGTLRFGRQGSPNGVEPQIDWTIGTTIWQLNVYDTLVTNDMEGFLAPCLAESWEVLDERSYRFEIRQGVTFHDGAPLTADDVIFSFERILDEETGATRLPQFENIESFEATDDFTVEVVLREPYATFLTVLANRASVIVSRGFEGDYSQEMNGTGPFMAEPWEVDVVYPLARNPNYWEPGKPYLDRLEIIPIPDDNARVAALRSGGVEFADYIPFPVIPEIAADPNFTMFEGNEGYHYVRINVSRAPMDNKLVRQALNYAVDRQAVIDLAAGGRGSPMTVALIPPEEIWYNHELDGHWQYDPDRALELLAEAGYDDPSDLSFTLECSSEPLHLDHSQVLVEQWRALGISADIQPLDSAVRVEKRFSGDYTIMFDGANNPWPDPDSYSVYFASDGPVYATGVGFSNADIDRLLAEGRAITDDDAARQEIYRQVEEILLEEAPIIFLVYRTRAEACAANVHGYVRVPGVGQASMQFMENVWIDDEV